jgi:GxxExxY protein
MEKNSGDSNLPRFGGIKNDWEFPLGDLTERIIGAAIHVHRHLGPGFLEKIYENALKVEFLKRGIIFHQQASIRIVYNGELIGMHRLDLLVENKVVVEIKSVKSIDDIHLATVFSYLKATNLDVGLILNYCAPTLKIRRVVRAE